jgi:hypothetical protein
MFRGCFTVTVANVYNVVASSVGVCEGRNSINIENHLVSVWIHEKSRVGKIYMRIKAMAEANLIELEKTS